MNNMYEIRSLTKSLNLLIAKAWSRIAFFRSVALCAAVMTGCAGPGVRPDKKVVLDQSGDGGSAPAWVMSDRSSFEEGEQIYLRGSAEVLGSERLDACSLLASQRSREMLLESIAEDILRELDHAQQSMSEEAAHTFGLLRTGKIRGTVQGMALQREYYQRYAIGDTERIRCFALGVISRRDYQRARSVGARRLVESDSRLKDVLFEKHRHLIGDEHGNRAVAAQQDEARSGGTGGSGPGRPGAGASSSKGQD